MTRPFAVNPPWPELSRTNSVLHGRSRDYHVDRYRGTLSLKSVVEGEGLWRTSRGVFRVDAGSFLLLNDGQEYSLDIEGRTPTETVCLFFETGFVERTAGDLAAPVAALLDDPAREGRPPFDVVERLYPKTGAIAAALAQLSAGLASGAASSAWLEDRFFDFAGRLVALRDETEREADAFPGRHAATRRELQRRLHLARDFVDSCFAEPLTVARIAEVACLSPFHFHRAFRRAFGITPMQHLQRARLAAAERLLRSTDRPVSRICRDVGFESFGSFSALFRRRFGEPPSSLRRRSR
jgi:AraC-like DNA-binding protein